MAKRPRKIESNVTPFPQPSVNDIAASNRITLTGRGPRQKAFLQSIKRNPLTIGLGPAGTGKTWLACGMALQTLLRGEMEKIVLSRAAVAVEGENPGALPGNLRAKYDPWMRPFLDAMADHLKSKSKVEDMIKDGKIEFIPFAFMRGLTIKAFIILDEAQNTTQRQMELFCGRLGEGAKVVICGDVDQCDLRLLPGQEDGLSALVNMLEGRGLAETVEFLVDDIQRSELAKQLVIGWKEYKDVA